MAGTICFSLHLPFILLLSTGYTKKANWEGIFDVKTFVTSSQCITTQLCQPHITASLTKFWDKASSF